MMPPLATVADYERRFGAVDDEEMLETLLGDATAFISAHLGGHPDQGDETLMANLERICCSVVRRSLDAGDFTGIQSYSQGGDGYSASITLSNPAGDFYLTASEKRVLGIGRGRVGQTWPCGKARGGCDAPCR